MSVAAWLSVFSLFFLSLNEMIAVFSDLLCICHETLVVFCGICLLRSFYPVNKIQKTLVKQNWPDPDKLVVLNRNFLPTGLDCLLVLFCFVLFGWARLVRACGLVTPNWFLPTLLKGFLSLTFTITWSLRGGQMLFGET